MQKMVSSCFSFLVKTEKTKRLKLHQGRLGLEMKKQVLGEGLQDTGMNGKQNYAIPIFGILKLMWSAWINVAEYLPASKRRDFCGPSALVRHDSLCWVCCLWREPSAQSQEPAALWQSCSPVCWGKLTLHVPFDSNGSNVVRDLSDCQMPPWNRKSILNKSFRACRLRVHL